MRVNWEAYKEETSWDSSQIGSEAEGTVNVASNEFNSQFISLNWYEKALI